MGTGLWRGQSYGWTDDRTLARDGGDRGGACGSGLSRWKPLTVSRECSGLQEDVRGGASDGR